MVARDCCSAPIRSSSYLLPALVRLRQNGIASSPSCPRLWRLRRLFCVGQQASDLILRNAGLRARLRRWPPGRSRLRPSFETPASKSAVADFGTFGLPKSDRPDSVRAPQDEAEGCDAVGLENPQRIEIRGR